MPETSTMQTLTEVRGDLVLAALCVGQFRAPCQIDSDRLLVKHTEDYKKADDGGYEEQHPDRVPEAEAEAEADESAAS